MITKGFNTNRVFLSIVKHTSIKVYKHSLSLVEGILGLLHIIIRSVIVLKLSLITATKHKALV